MTEGGRRGGDVESPAKHPISADPPIGLYLVDIRVQAPDPPFCRRLVWGEGHGSALLFWCELSRSWGKWGLP